MEKMGFWGMVAAVALGTAAAGVVGAVLGAAVQAGIAAARRTAGVSQ